MSFDAKRLYELLPAIYRIRDSEQGKTLEALLTVVAEQIAVLEEDMAQLYDDQFIETCADWVVPYIGDLIGYRSLHGTTPQVRSPRAEVANTIGYRRRKGTVIMLEQLARDVTGWNARVVEFFQLLATTQYMNHLRPGNLYSPDLRGMEPLEYLNTPFDSLVHTADVRHIASRRGRYNIPNIGIFLWRLGSYSLTSSPAFKLDDHRYLFNPLGTNTPLFTNSPTDGEITHIAEQINVSMPISRQMLDKHLADYYGRGKSIFIQNDGMDVLIGQIKVCDLSDITGGGWAHNPPAKTIAIDPVLGRIAFADAPSGPPLVTFYYGFSADMGGGEYARENSLNLQLRPVENVPSSYKTIHDALDTLQQGVVEISNSGHYEEKLVIQASSNGQIELRATDTTRPCLVLDGELQISGGDNAGVTINGLIISGNYPLVAEASNLQKLRLQHCTLVPGLSLSADGTPQRPSAPSLIIKTAASVEIDRCILGGLQVTGDAHVQITNSIVDATSESNFAYSALDGNGPGGTLHVENSTIIGMVNTMMMELASNTIFMAPELEAPPVRAERRQQGCVRFSYLPLSSQVPRRYYCQPESNNQAGLVRPQFTSLRYGDAGYCQLSRRCPDEIRKGADDEAEMGAFHNLFQPQRETDLQVRLDEYLRFSLEAGIIYVT